MHPSTDQDVTARHHRGWSPPPEAGADRASAATSPRAPTADTVRRPAAGRRGTFATAPGNALRGARLAGGLSMREFAVRCSVSVACVSRWETDVRRPHSRDAARIATVLKRPEAEVSSWFRAPVIATEALRDARGLRVLRHRAGLSRAELALAAHVAPATIAHWECGRRALPARRWPVLARALDIGTAGFVEAVRSEHYRPRLTPMARLRRRGGLSQRDVAVRLGVSPGLVSRWERGVQRPGWPHLRRLAFLLNVPLSSIADAAGQAAPTSLDPARWSSSTVGAAIRAVRVWRGDSRSELARRIGVHPQTLRRWEAGSTFPPRTLLPALDHALGLSPGTLPR